MVDSQSRSFFMPRQISSDPVFEYAMTQYQIYCTADSQEYPSKLYIKPFYQHSMNKSDLAGYFFPSNKERIIIRQDGMGDVCSVWLNLFGPYVEDEENNEIKTTNYSSCFSLQPVRVTYGGCVEWYVDLDRAIPNTWFSLNTTIMQAEHALNPHEEGGGIGTEVNLRNAYDAFDNCEWCVGKIVRGKLKRNGVDDIQLKLGYDLQRNENYHIGVYGITSIPTGAKPCSCYLFEPIVGSRHTSIGMGFNLSKFLFERNDRKVTFLFDFHYRYLFSGVERRVFDLTNNGDWSRYLQVVTTSEPYDTKPALNMLYFDADITPGSTLDLWAALHYEYRNLNLEVGYNFWWRTGERAKICGCFKPGYYIYDLTSGCDPEFTCSPCANISQAAEGSNTVTSTTDCHELELTDIDLCSGLHPRCCTHKFYGALSYHNHQNGFPTFIGIGVSGEITPSCCCDRANYFGKQKLALEQAAVWLVLGASF